MHGSETCWPMKVQHELKMNRTEMSMCGVKLNVRKKSEELLKLRTLRIGTNQFDDQKAKRWFGYVEREDDNDWVKCCMM